MVATFDPSLGRRIAAQSWFSPAHPIPRSPPRSVQGESRNGDVQFTVRGGYRWRRTPSGVVGMSRFFEPSNNPPPTRRHGLIDAEARSQAHATVSVPFATEEIGPNPSPR